MAKNKAASTDQLTDQPTGLTAEQAAASADAGEKIDAILASLATQTDVAPPGPPDPACEPKPELKPEDVAGHRIEVVDGRIVSHSYAHETMPDPPPMNERQKSRLEAELGAGAACVARAAEVIKNRPKPPADPTEGKSVPVFRPGDRIPAFSSTDPALASQNLK